MRLPFSKTHLQVKHPTALRYFFLKKKKSRARKIAHSSDSNRILCTSESRPHGWVHTSPVLRPWFVKSTQHLARIHTHDFFSRVAQAHIALFFMRCFPTWPSSRAHVMFRTLLDPPLTSPTLGIPISSSLLFPSYWPTTCTPQNGLSYDLFGQHRIDL